MTSSNREGVFEIKPLDIIGQYGVQRFRQFGAEDTANWYVVKGDNTKRPYAMYPVMGRAHINYLGFNQLIFGGEPRGLFKSISYEYTVVGNSIIRIDTQYNQINISGTQLLTSSGPIYFTFLVVNSIVFACFVDQQKIYVYQENTGIFYVVTDPNAPGNSTVNGVLTKPGFIATFGNRITVSVLNSSQFFLSVINLLNASGVFDPATCFTNPTGAVFAQENGIIRQMGVLNNTLYIFTDYITGIWSNNQAIFSGTGVTFPWKKNSAYDLNFGIANSSSLDIDFGVMIFLARNSDGLLQFMRTYGDQPKVISSKAIDSLLQRYTNLFGAQNPFLVSNSNGFLFQYENTIFYRMSGGDYRDYGILDQEQMENSIEFNFENDSWHRCIELNGERSRVQYHVYFNYKHLVTVINDNTVYNMSGQYYTNEIRNPDEPNEQASDAYLIEPFRYERTTPPISEEDYAEFETDYVEIDFIFGDSNINYSINANAIPTINDLTYNYLVKPNIELFFSDDGGISFLSADNREFSQMGVYQWRMRWYQLGPSRNRVYKLVCVSPVPIVILGGVMNTRRISGGAN